jgi:2-polyprenyl-6-methoxyphenol hydroxylase-like FAD-dependent oxidoreductase
MRIIVVGGGIGGLTAAIALRRIGVDVEVYEQAAELREVGAGIGLAGNALRALGALGLADELLSQSVAAAQGGLRRPNGEVLAAMAGDELSRRMGTVAVAHRAELLAMLRGHVDQGRVHLAHRCVAVNQDSNGVTAQFENGETVRADALVGADGLRSVVRRCLFGNSAVRYAGYTAWRAVVNAKIEPVIGEAWGRGQRFGIVPMAGGRVYWFAVKNAPEGERDPAGGAKKALAGLFRGWHRPIEDLIAAAQEESILRNDIYDIEPLPRFVRGRVALLGDAAHAMTPNLGQGACQAIEDSVVLAALVQSKGQIEAALAEYDRRRRARTRTIVLWARRLGRVAQLENPALCWLRDFGMKMSPKGPGVQQMKALFETEILTADEETRLKRGAEREV